MQGTFIYVIDLVPKSVKGLILLQIKWHNLLELLKSVINDYNILIKDN